MVKKETTQKPEKTSEVPLNKLVGLGRDIVGEIYMEHSPSFYTPVRSRSNVFFSEEDGVLTLGDKKEKRTFIHVSQAKKFMQTVAIAAKLKSFLEQGLHTSIRGLYYQLKFSLGDDLDEDLFEEQSESNPLIEDLEASLDLKREDFNLSTDRKGVVAGNMIIRDKFGGEENIIDASKQGRSGWMIPSDVDNDIEFVDVNADYVLCLPADETIPIIDNGQLTIKSVHDIYETLRERNRDIQVISYNRNYNTCKNDLFAISKRKARSGEKVVKITTQSGAEVRVSDYHKVPVLTADGVKVVAARDIKKGDFVFEAKSIHTSLKQTHAFDLVEMLKDDPAADDAYVYGASERVGEVSAEWLGLMVAKTVDGRTYTHPHHVASRWNEHVIPLKHYLKFEGGSKDREMLRIGFDGLRGEEGVKCVIKADDNLARLLGYYLAKGYISEHRVGFSMSKEELRHQQEVCNLIEQVFGVKPIMHMNDSKIEISVQSKAVALFLKKLNIGSCAHTKGVPDFVFGMPSSFIKNVLECYLGGDGHRLTTVSKRLYDGLTLLLKKIGIPTYTGRIKVGTSSAHELYYIDMRGKYFDDKHQGRWLHADVHPVEVKEVEMSDYNGDFYELVAVSPHNIFMHSCGVFTHNCVEKDALWQRLNEDKFWKKNNCILITPKGQASRGTRRLIRKLADMKLPIYVFTDCDAWGWYIYWTIKTGSMNLAFLNKSLATPEAKFIGVTMSDIQEFDFLKRLTINAKEVDLKRAEEMKSYPWIARHKEWVAELDIVLKTRKKLEQDALQGQKLTFVGDYVKDKIENNKVLP